MTILSINYYKKEPFLALFVLATFLRRHRHRLIRTRLLLQASINRF